MEYIALIIGIITYGLIISRSIIKVPLWASMFFGGILMIVTGVITLQEAYSSVNLDVILFLMTLFMFSSALEVSGFLKFLAYKLVSRYKDPKKVLFYILFYAGILSNLVTNDGISSSWTPVVLEASKAMKVDELPFLYALAFGVTIGSVMMPTGNPQNLLILLESNTPFLIFVAILLIPTMINFILSYFVLLLIFRKKLSNITVDDNLGNIQIQNKRLAYSSLILLAITIILFFVLSIYRIDIVLASLVTSSILLLVNRERREIIQKVDWSVIVFFIGLFIFTEGLVKGGIMDALYHIVPLPTNTATIMASSVVLSQILSNVPLVAIYIQEMQKLGAISILNWLALAAGSTIAGNFTILGAASNVIVSEASESRGGKGFNFLEFIKYALPILAVNFVVLYLFISFVGTILIQLLTPFH
ncbi:SLC13 family permease [Sulfolobus acidocaldarius]|uniref:SLC13 family permease n=1 Tax=Sulfolobus acidocaldarius TaxID=2285 RepID=UPI000780C7F7|nr:SLC13 family permease [Sulfolobus acidocaldarius]